MEKEIEHLRGELSILGELEMGHKWDKVFKNGPSKIF